MERKDPLSKLRDLKRRRTVDLVLGCLLALCTLKTAILLRHGGTGEGLVFLAGAILLFCFAPRKKRALMGALVFFTVVFFWNWTIPSLLMGTLCAVSLWLVYLWELKTGSAR